MNDFTENSTAEEIIKKLDEYMPCLDEDKQFIKKYRSDFIYHYNKDFCNLALFSFHYLYMFIVNTSMVKFYAFNKAIICNQTGNNNNSLSEPFLYFGRQSEKNVIHNNTISNENKNLHIDNVKKRDNIAHTSGIVFQKSVLTDYINNCFKVLEELQLNAIEKCCLDNKIQISLHNYDDDIVDSLCSGNTAAVESIILDFMKDLYLSNKDIISLKKFNSMLNAISYFTPYICIDSDVDGDYFLNWDDSYNLHKAIYDDFCSKYEQALASNSENVLDKNKILKVLKADYVEADIDTIYNVAHKLISLSEYWVHIGTSKYSNDKSQILKKTQV